KPRDSLRPMSADSIDEHLQRAHGSGLNDLRAVAGELVLLNGCAVRAADADVDQADGLTRGAAGGAGDTGGADTEGGPERPSRALGHLRRAFLADRARVLQYLTRDAEQV